MTLLSASILAADFAHLESQTRTALDAGADWIHIDVMDGHFVPNLTMGSVVVEALRPLAEEKDALMDVHLMIERPDEHVEAFAKAGADLISVHVEVCPHLHRTIHKIRDLGVRPGVTLNPATPLYSLEPVLADVDLVLIMSVNPGFAGQSFIESSIDRIRSMREMLDQVNPGTHLEVDGGIKSTNAARVVEAGADVLVSGSGIFRGDIETNVAALKRAFATVA